MVRSRAKTSHSGNTYRTSPPDPTRTLRIVKISESPAPLDTAHHGLHRSTRKPRLAQAVDVAFSARRVHHLGRGAHEIHVEIGFDRVNALERLLRLLDTVEVRQRDDLKHLRTHARVRLSQRLANPLQCLLVAVHRQSPCSREISEPTCKNLCVDNFFGMSTIGDRRM